MFLLVLFLDAVASGAMARKSSSQPDFNFQQIKKHIQECYDDDLDMNSYLKMYAEFNKMFSKFGRVFSMVTSEINDKSKILEKFLESKEHSVNYQKVQAMLDYEMSNNLICYDPKELSKKNMNSGSRTFLQLHRALDFVLHFMEGTRTANENQNMEPLVRISYDKTLANYHSWLVRKGVYLALLTLPTRKKFLADLVGNTMAPQEVNKVISETVENGRQLYDSCQNLYEERELLNLP